MLKFLSEADKSAEFNKLKELAEESAYNMNSPKYE